MDGKREQLFFVGAFVLAGVLTWLELGDRYDTAAKPRAKDSEVVEDPLGQFAPAALAIPNAWVEYEITITNTGTVDATDVVVTDDIQAELTFATGRYNGGASDVEIVDGAGPPVKRCTSK